MGKTHTYERNEIIKTKSGLLTVINEFRNNTNRQKMLELSCYCGKVFTTYKQNVRSGATSSCGCYALSLLVGKSPNKVTHGQSWVSGKPTPTYMSWSGMKNRCKNKSYKSYHRYGGRGINTCDRWLGEDGFINFFNDMGQRPEGRTLDRIDNNGDYTPENCRWADPTTQSRNRNVVRLFEYEGRSMTIMEWSVVTKLTDTTIRNRLRRGWTIDKALTTPTRDYPGFHSITPFI